ncbi:enterochelin esterase [Acinetobacter vivianii]|uniref:enterochelin esterase n=1 Tax=Acinetobacter vivianii TaxID=1776742 RepID=UPI002DBEB20A|nr:enterochelin esterase [Acinetobacter vivianii]MEB6478863.1 enterochelin esterase [Acinetobacter vivianii]MEB6657305.1 enterochelin esterase [Acinetobacter vivianii]
MKPNYFPIHPIFQQKNLGSDIWWNSVEHIGTPLVIEDNQQLHCTFLWRRQSETESTYIDVYSQSPTIYQQWNAFQQIENTDISFFEITLPLNWSGSYVLVTTLDSAPETPEAQLRRQWWINQLQHYVQVDRLNPYPPYPAQVSRWVNQLHLGQPQDSRQANVSPVYESIEWYSQHLATTYQVDFYQTASLTENSPLVILLDGQIWSQHLPILQDIQLRTDQGQMGAANYVFLHSINSEQRCLDYGCRDLFSQAIVEELIPYIQQNFSLSPSSPVFLCGQSLGGLCALHSLLLYPTAFQGLILQSGSYWWSDYSNSDFLNGHTQRFLEVIEHYLQPIPNETQIFIRTGAYETDMREDSQLLYATLSSVRPTQIHTFAGGHDAINWKYDLVDTLQTLIS